MERMKDFVVEKLWCKIEYLRQEMHVTALKEGMSHPDVLMVSQKLDEAINEIYKLVMVQNVG